MSTSSALPKCVTETLLELSDDRLVLGHRLSEWCGHGPIIEEDIAMANIALDLIGHATNGLTLVAAEMGDGVTADSLAFFRTDREYRNLIITEQPNGDFANTMVRQFLFDAYSVPLLQALSEISVHSCEPLAGWAAKCHKEDLYHLRHSSQWVLRLGDGTAESKGFAQDSLNNLWRFAGEMLSPSAALTELFKQAPTRLAEIATQWRKTVAAVCAEATLTVPTDPSRFVVGGRIGQHSEHLGHLLAEMQSLPRSQPNAQW